MHHKEEGKHVLVFPHGSKWSMCVLLHNCVLELLGILSSLFLWQSWNYCFGCMPKFLLGGTLN